MKSLLKALLFLTAFGGLSSCVSVAHLPTDDASKPQALQPSKGVKVYATDDIGREYVVVGEVIALVDAGQNSKRPVSFLKGQAQQLGADAIMNLRLEFGVGYWVVGIQATGTAVRFIESNTQ